MTEVQLIIYMTKNGNFERLCLDLSLINKEGICDSPKSKWEAWFSAARHLAERERMTGFLKYPGKG